MREKTINYNNNEYRVRLYEDQYGLPTLKIDKKEKLFGFFIWINQKKYWWDYTRDGKDLNPIEFATEKIKEWEDKEVAKEEYEKKLDEWFA